MRLTTLNRAKSRLTFNEVWIKKNLLPKLSVDMNKLSSSFAFSSSDCNIAGTTSSNTTGITATGDVPCDARQDFSYYIQARCSVQFSCSRKIISHNIVWICISLWKRNEKLERINNCVRPQCFHSSCLVIDQLSLEELFIAELKAKCCETKVGCGFLT